MTVLGPNDPRAIRDPKAQGCVTGQGIKALTEYADSMATDPSFLKELESVLGSALNPDGSVKRVARKSRTRRSRRSRRSRGDSTPDDTGRGC